MATNKDHAKQFMPFDSLKGLREELEKKEIKKEERKILSDSSLEALEREFRKLTIGSNVKVVYYDKIKYRSILGIIQNIDYFKKQIIINNIKINISNITSLEL